MLVSPAQWCALVGALFVCLFVMLRIFRSRRRGLNDTVIALRRKGSFIGEDCRCIFLNLQVFLSNALPIFYNLQVGGEDTGDGEDMLCPLPLVFFLAV